MSKKPLLEERAADFSGDVSPDVSLAVSVKRIADALEDLVALISALEHMAERELRARRVFAEEPAAEEPS